MQVERAGSNRSCRKQSLRIEALSQKTATRQWEPTLHVVSRGAAYIYLFISQLISPFCLLIPPCSFPLFAPRSLLLRLVPYKTNIVSVSFIHALLVPWLVLFSANNSTSCCCSCTSSSFHPLFGSASMHVPTSQSLCVPEDERIQLNFRK